MTKDENRIEQGYFHMKLKNQVCSLELSKMLKKLGVEQDSQFYYVPGNSSGKHVLEQEVWMIAHRSQAYNIGKDFISAFSVAELGEMLPDAVLLDNQLYFIKYQKKDNEYKVYIDNLTNIIIFFSDNEANARAKMLIYLIENKLVTPTSS